MLKMMFIRVLTVNGWLKTNIIQESFNQVEDRTVLSPFYVYQNNEYII